MEKIVTDTDQASQLPQHTPTIREHGHKDLGRFTIHWTPRDATTYHFGGDGQDGEQRFEFTVGSGQTVEVTLEDRRYHMSHRIKVFHEANENPPRTLGKLYVTGLNLDNRLINFE